MKTKSFILCGVAVAALIGITPAIAFTHHPGTPAEHRQTEDLDQQQLDQAQSPANAQTGATTNNQQANAVPGAMSNTQAGERGRNRGN